MALSLDLIPPTNGDTKRPKLDTACDLHCEGICCRDVWSILWIGDWYAQILFFNVLSTCSPCGLIIGLDPVKCRHQMLRLSWLCAISTVITAEVTNQLIWLIRDWYPQRLFFYIVSTCSPSLILIGLDPMKFRHQMLRLSGLRAISTALFGAI